MLRVRLLGALDVELDGATITSPPSQRPWAVFAYLALEDRPIPRTELASRFWPDVLDQSAKASLRSALWALKRELGDRIVVDRERVALGVGGTLWTDVGEFELLARSENVEQALELCRGDLLEGMDDEWALAARERHRERLIALLEQRAADCLRRGAGREAVAWTRRQVQTDPFDEEAHRRLIARLAEIGDRAGALRVYRTLAERLRRELGVAPSSRTRELIDQLRTDAPAAEAPRRSAGARPGLLPLVGRDPELRELLAAWRSASAGAGAAAVIRGEAGIGKTRLTIELRLRADAGGGRAVACAALDLGGTAPLSLWAELLRDLLPAIKAPPAESAWPDDLAVLATELPTHFGRSGRPNPTVAPELQRTRLFEAVVALLEWASVERPLLLVLEDIHAADRQSLELAAYAARRAAELPLMLLFTRRQAPRSGDSDALEHSLRARGLLAVELELAPLSPEALANLARCAAPLDTAAVTRVVQRAEGNALLAVETARSLARGTGEVAGNLRASVRAGLSPLGADAREFVDLAAVAGRAIEPIELEQLGLPAAADIIGEALDTGILEAAGTRVGFRHALLREAVYAELPAPRARSLHERWAQNLLSSEHAGGPRRPAEVARHLVLAGRNGPAVDELARAAADARAVGALAEAAGYLREAISISTDRTDLLLELGEVEAWRARREDAESAFARARALLADAPPLSLARAWLRQARAFHGPLCVPHDVLEACRNALELLDRAEEPARAERREALAALAWSEAVAGSFERAEQLLEQLSAYPEDSDLGAYDVGHARAYALMRRGRFEESWRPAIAGAEAAERTGRHDLAYGCWAAAAGAAAAIGQYERALELIDRGSETLRDNGLASIEVHMLAARSFLLTRMGRHDDARTAARLERRLAEQLDQPELVSMAQHDQGLVELAAGRHEQAASLLSAALVEGAPISRPLTRLALAEALVGSGQLDEAQDELRATVLEPVRPSDFPDSLVARLTRIQGLLARARGDDALARRRLRESIAGWERQIGPTVQADNINTVLADLGRPVVGLIEPERELARARADLEVLTHAVVP